MWIISQWSYKEQKERGDGREEGTVDESRGKKMKKKLRKARADIGSFLYNKE